MTNSFMLREVFCFALFAATLMARADGAPAHRDYRIFPTNSTVQCVIDGKVLEDFPPIARLKDAFASSGQFTGAAGVQLAEAAAGEEFLRANVSYYAFALLPADVNAQSKDKHGTADDEDDDSRAVAYIGFSTNVTVKALDELVGSVMKSAASEEGGAVVIRESLPDGLVRISVTNAAPPKAKGNGKANDVPDAFYFACADDTLAVAGSEESLVREIVGDVRAGRVFRPSIPARRPFFWLSAEIDPVEFFGDEEEDEDEPSVLETMPFLKGLSRITASAEGVAKDASILVVLSAKFASQKSAAAAANTLRPFLAFLPQAGDETLAQLAARAKIGTSGNDCRVTVTFSREDIGKLIDSMAPRE